MTVDSPPLVCIAAVATAHGVRGALRLKTFTEAPENVAAYGPVFDDKGRPLFGLRVIGAVKDGVIVEADGIRDRNAAELLRGKRLYVPRSALPPTEDDEFYHEDLVGLAAVDPDGAPLGRVEAVLNYGGGDLLDIVGDHGKRLTLPFTRAVVPEVDLAARRLVCRVPDEVVVETQP